jgi:hypothetical protein
MKRFSEILSTVKDNLAALARGEEEVTELVIAERSPANGLARCCVQGYMQQHAFSALLYPQHAIEPGRELQQSLISKLDIRRLHDWELVANYDRGWEVRPTTPVAQKIVDYLIANLATRVYGRLTSVSQDAISFSHKPSSK